MIKRPQALAHQDQPLTPAPEGGPATTESDGPAPMTIRTLTWPHRLTRRQPHDHPGDQSEQDQPIVQKAKDNSGLWAEVGCAGSDAPRQPR